MQDNDPNLEELARIAGIPTESVHIIVVPNISPSQATLADEIAEAISDTLDMDWQPRWAAPNIIAIINRERRRAREEGAKAMRAMAAAVADERAADGQDEYEDGIEAAECIASDIRALDPAQIAAKDAAP